MQRGKIRRNGADELPAGAGVIIGTGFGALVWAGVLALMIW